MAVVVEVIGLPAITDVTVFLMVVCPYVPVCNFGGQKDDEEPRETKDSGDSEGDGWDEANEGLRLLVVMAPACTGPFKSGVLQDDVTSGVRLDVTGDSWAGGTNLGVDFVSFSICSSWLCLIS